MGLNPIYIGGQQLSVCKELKLYIYIFDSTETEVYIFYDANASYRISSLLPAACAKCAG